MSKFIYPLAIIIIVGGVFLLWNGGSSETLVPENNTPEVGATEEPLGETPEEKAAACPAELADFSKTGNLIRNNPGFEPDVWFLSYEEPGKPGLNARLELADCSSCTVSGVATPCEELALENGTRVTVTGVTEENGVLVRTLTTE